MSDSDFEPQDELKRSLEEFQLKKRLQSQSSSEDVFSPLSSPRQLSNDTEAKSEEPQPTTNWTVVEVGSSSAPKQEPPKPEPPKQEASKIVTERAKPQVPTKPKPAPPPKTKLKSPSKELSAPKYTVTTTSTNVKSPSNVSPPKRVSDYQEITIDRKTSKEELSKLELMSDSAEDKALPSASPNGGVRGMMSLFEGGKQQMPTYSQPDMSKKKRKSFFTSEDKASSVTEKTKDEDIVEVTPVIPDRKYTEEDVSSLSPSFKPLPPPPPVRSSSPQMSPKQTRFNSLKTSTSPVNSTPDDDENPYEVVTPRQKETSPVPPPPPLHQRRFESRQDVPPAPPSPFRDRRPEPPARDVSLASSSPCLPSTVTVDSDYAEVTESVRRPLVSNESPYSEAEDIAAIPEVEAYYTTDILRNLPTKTGGDAKRAPPPKPLPYQLKNTVEDTSKSKILPDPKPVKTPPAKPAPYRPKSFQEDLPSDVPSGEKKLQSPVSPTSPRVPLVIPGSPRLSSARIVSDPAPSTSSSPNLERSPKFKPPPPPRVSSIADATKGEVTQAAKSPVEENRLNSYSPVNGVLDHFDKNEIPTRDVDTALSSKPNLPRKPQFGSRPSHAVEEAGPPSFRPPPPPNLSLVPKAYGVNSGSISPDRERAGSQNGIDSFGIIAPPPMEWMDGKTGRSSSRTSVDSLDLKIVPPPPVHFKELDINNEHQTVSSTFDIPTVNPPSSWQEGPENSNFNNVSLNSRNSKSRFKKGYLKRTGNVDYDIAIVPPPPPSEPPPTLPFSGPLDYELDLVPSPLSDGPGGLNIEDILGDLDTTLSATSDDEDLPPAPLPPGERYAGVPPPPGDGISKPLVPPLRKQR